MICCSGTLGEVLCENESNLDLFLRASMAEDILDV